MVGRKDEGYLNDSPDPEFISVCLRYKFRIFFISLRNLSHLYTSILKILRYKLDAIIDKCKQGDRKAAEMLYKTFAAKMFAVCIHFSKDRSDAEDTLQDGFIKIFASLGQYSGKGSFEGWMKRIFINTALEKFRKNHQMQLVEEFPDVEEEDIEENVRIPEEILSDFIQQLPERYRLVFNLYVLEDMQHKEIAASLGITEGTSKSNLARAREILKRKVKEYLDHE